MTGTQFLRIGDIASVKGGKRLPAKAELVTEVTGHPYIRGRDIRDGRITFNDPVYITEEVHQAIQRYIVEEGDVCITIVGNIGDVGVTPPSLHRANLTENAVKLVELREDCDRQYLAYALLSPHAQAQMKLSAAGAAQPKLGIYKVNEIQIPFPSLPTQRRIASILSAYDDLIENNTRRIAILEEMARRIYEEWFVRFRFPGHEQVKLVESELGLIPEGWEAGALGNYLQAMESGKRPKGGVSEIADGVPSIGAENVNGIGRHNFSSEKLVPKEFFGQMRKGVVKDRDVALYKDGAYIGRSSYFRDGFPHAICCVNEHVFLLRSDGGRVKQNFLYLWLQHNDTVDTIRSSNANAAQPGINQQTVNGLKLICPDKETANRFDEIVEPLLAGIINLSKKNRVLSTTRDLLLPKLISGELDVSSLPEPEAVAA
jgi:type I restriction enzyme S subunit